MSNNNSASKDLANILSKLNAEKYKDIIKRAALNGYHDHKFDSIPGHPEYAECVCPKMQLIEDLGKFPELIHIQKEVMEGKYDDPADEQDAEEMRGWLMDDGAADGMFSAIGLKVPTKEEREARAKGKLLN